MASLDFLDPRLRSPRATATTTLRLLGHNQEDDDSEWEYEYSATETETFYVTLDLSKADFKAQDQVKHPPVPSRGGWQAHRASELFLNRRKATERVSHNSAASSAASSDAERDEGDQPAPPPESQDKQSLSTPDDSRADPERVQILDLHSENPIISYKGRVFSGQWCENITTELLLMRHDEESDLPVLRHLGDGVDLLAASSSRINVTEQKLRPKDSERERQRASAHLPQTVIPPVDPKASQERTDQRNFLADLIALKRRKGEVDDVTVIARSMQGKRGKGKRLQTHRRGRWLYPGGLHAVHGLEGKSRRGGKRRGGYRVRGKWALFPLQEAVRDPVPLAPAGTQSPSVGEPGISMPTPFRWDDLEELDGSPAPMEELIGADLDEEQDDDDIEDDENNDYEEDEEEDQEEMDEDEDEDEDEIGS